MIPWLKGLLADPNGVPDDGRLAALLIVLSYIGNSAYALHLGQVWNPQDYGKRGSEMEISVLLLTAPLPKGRGFQLH